jgi:hypothetical protein
MENISMSLDPYGPDHIEAFDRLPNIGVHMEAEPLNVGQGASEHRGDGGGDWSRDENARPHDDHGPHTNGDRRT